MEPRGKPCGSPLSSPRTNPSLVLVLPTICARVGRQACAVGSCRTRSTAGHGVPAPRLSPVTNSTLYSVASGACSTASDA